MSDWRIPRLSAGARIALVAPAGPFDRAAFERGVARLSTRYEVWHQASIVERLGFLAGSDERRLAELQAALADDTVDAVVAVRGGYGSTRLLPALDPDALSRRPKLLVGFSDITALHALWARARVGSLHAPMVAALGQGDDTQLQAWFSATEGKLPAALSGLECIAPGRAEGRLLGGNLAVLCALLPTPYAPPLDGAVLFLEDVGERPYRIDRMLTTLEHSGVLSRVAAVVLGQFTDASPGPDGTSVGSVLLRRLRPLGVPVLGGLPAGHVDDNLPLPFGRRVVVDADAGTLGFET